jgi:hypothetical protein
MTLKFAVIHHFHNIRIVLLADVEPQYFKLVACTKQNDHTT